MSRIYGAAIVGAGIGRSHMAGYLALPDRFRVDLVCDLDAARGQELAALAPDCGYTDSYDAVLADDRIDIVNICLPPHLHFDACMKALDAGKAIICEKPLVASLAQADALAAKLAETGGFLSPVFQYRYGLGTAQLAALDAAGLTGKPFVATLETHWNRQKAYYDIDWRGTWAGEQGGAILGHAIHIHDLLSHCLGPVASVFAELATRVNEIEVEDCAALSIRMENGALVTSSVTLGAADDTSRMRLCYEGVTVESDHAPYSLAEKAWSFTARAPFEQADIDSILANVAEPSKGYAAMFAAAADALEGRPGAEVDFAAGRRSLEFVTAVYSSARSGQPVALPLDACHPMYESWTP